ncbi:MAG: DUF3592 domain-containing protein [Gloeomargarita sp. HHBFW_bins_162]
MEFFIILVIFAPLIIIGLIIANYVRLIRNFWQVLADGIETNGVIVRKVRSGRRYYRVTYEYHDQNGQTHRNGLDVFRSEHHNYQVGDTIQIVYSASKPHLSSTKAIVDQALQAKK